MIFQLKLQNKYLRAPIQPNNPRDPMASRIPKLHIINPPVRKSKQQQLLTVISKVLEFFERFCVSEMYTSEIMMSISIEPLKNNQHVKINMIQKFSK